jgi:hypothetical protein
MVEMLERRLEGNNRKTLLQDLDEEIEKSERVMEILRQRQEEP